MNKKGGICGTHGEKRIAYQNLVENLKGRDHLGHLRIGGCIQKFPDWPPGARTANGTSSLPLGAIVLLFRESV